MKELFESTYGKVSESIVAPNEAHYPEPEMVLHSMQSQDFRDSENFLHLGFIGNDIPEKGRDTALAFAQVIASGTPVRFLDAGPRGSLTSQLPFVIPLGSVVDERKASFFSSIDVLLFPSRYRYEADPLVVHEALSNGVPVVAQRIGCLATSSHPAVLLVDDWRSESRRISQWIKQTDFSSDARRRRKAEHLQRREEHSIRLNEDLDRFFQSCGIGIDPRSAQ